MILTHPALTKLTFMDYLLTMLRNWLRRKLSYDTQTHRVSGCGYTWVMYIFMNHPNATKPPESLPRMRQGPEGLANSS